MADIRTIRVFLDPSGDLAVVRFKELIDELNGGFAEGAKVKSASLCSDGTLALSEWQPQAVVKQPVSSSSLCSQILSRTAKVKKEESRINGN